MSRESSPSSGAVADAEAQLPPSIFEVLAPSAKKRVVLMVSMVALVTPFTDTVSGCWL